MNKKINGILIFLIIFLVIGVGVYWMFDAPKESWIITTREIIPQALTSLHIGGYFHSTIQQGDSNQIEIIADQNVQKCIVDEIIGAETKLSWSRECNFLGRTKTPVLVNITVETLEKLSVAGASTVRGIGELQLENDLELRALWASEVSLNIKAKSIKGNVSWASELNLDIEAEKLDLNVSGASEAVVGVIVENLFVNISGASEVTAQGEADFSEIEVSGASDFNGRELTTQKAELKASWASDIVINAIEVLSEKSTGASDIRTS